MTNDVAYTSNRGTTKEETFRISGGVMSNVSSAGTVTSIQINTIQNIRLTRAGRVYKAEIEVDGDTSFELVCDADKDAQAPASYAFWVSELNARLPTHFLYRGGSTSLKVFFITAGLLAVALAFWFYTVMHRTHLATVGISAFAAVQLLLAGLKMPATIRYSWQQRPVYALPSLQDG
ncbi:hypothetical protein [Dyella kyungheensis]|uniref:Uncharacterized protein n=1 Tax=Dyella kyungheensis TaxID=1242174 RepID=A0ABS2JXJ5_9GAMM|nr:hypothetical protein [Dyella kyungheensis]MBM7123334.1 hypothetical protein [Dyella kyungheensis]